MTAHRIVIMAGGTGGHVFPGLAVAEALRLRGWTVTWLGTTAGIEARVVPDNGLELDCIPVAGLRGRGPLGWLMLPFRLCRAVWAAWRILARRRPHVVLGMGGFASGPGGIAARLWRTPLVIHEQNAVAGLTNRVLARLAARVLCGFPGSFPPERRAETVGNPVRRGFAELPSPETRFAGREGPVRLLIIGGSQGARALNEQLPRVIRRLAPNAVVVRHQCGERWFDATRAEWRDSGVSVTVERFIEDMAAAFAWADLAVCRAGALTVAELAAAGLGAVLVPFPQAVDDHQTANAEYLERAGAARLLPQPRLEAGELDGILTMLTEERGLLLDMARRARRLARPDADEIVADACEAIAGEAAGGAA